LLSQTYPEPTVGGLIRREDGLVLLCDSHKWPGLYTVPGGHVELGETCEDALMREIKEEVGLEIKVLELVSIQQVIYPKEFWKRAHFIFFDYLCSIEGNQTPKVDANEIQGTIWVNPRDALKLNIDRYLKHFIGRLLDKENYPFIVAWRQA
jgi:phosphoglycolate phosphatase